MATTTKIATENARPSLAQTLEQMYKDLHSGGAYDVKKNIVRNGGYNQLLTQFGYAINPNTGEDTITTKGFKTKMQPQQTEFLMAKDAPGEGKITTLLRTSINGPFSNAKYENAVQKLLK